jgi:putative two-component system response regulator
MPDIYGNRSDINEIIELLPLKLIKHMTRVARIVNFLAQKKQYIDMSSCNFAKTEFFYYGEAAFYHDIGKAFVPYDILTKSCKFTREEFEAVKKHTTCAQVIFEDISHGSIAGIPEHLIDLARDAAVFHHEWWNGKGYPYGICRDEIPLIARITSVSDAYDAITNNRVYREARPHSEACRELKACSGTQFDPDIVKVFLDNEREIFDLVIINM